MRSGRHFVRGHAGNAQARALPLAVGQSSASPGFGWLEGKVYVWSLATSPGFSAQIRVVLCDVFFTWMAMLRRGYGEWIRSAVLVGFYPYACSVARLTYATAAMYFCLAMLLEGYMDGPSGWWLPRLMRRMRTPPLQLAA